MFLKLALPLFCAGVIGLAHSTKAQVPYAQTAPTFSPQQQLQLGSQNYRGSQQYQVIPAPPNVPPLTPAQLRDGTFATQQGAIGSVGVVPIETTDVRIPWSQKLVQSVQTQHSFGAVAAESKQEHVFEFTNTTPDTLQLVGVRASCGCTKPTILTHTVAPGERAKILAQFQTKTFRGEKKATVTVALQRVGQIQQYAEVQFTVSGKIRKDVVLIPGEVNFGTMTKESSVGSQQVVKMKYAGSPLWKILDIKSTNDHLNVEAREISREQSGRVAYELVVTTDGEMPAGGFEDQLTIITNDRKTSKMPISVSGRIRPSLEAASINLGTVKRGSKIEKRFVIRGDAPFEVKEVTIGSDMVKFSPPTGKKRLHVIPYIVDTSVAQSIDAKLTVLSNDDDPLKKVVDFTVQIIAETVAGAN